jgi:hypothetical protein
MAISGVGMTAKMAAAGRALESRRPDRLFDDPLAQALAGEDGFRWMEELRPPGSPAENPSIGPRTWFFDQLITRAAGDGFGQVVLLAAGMDTRAFRLRLPAGIATPGSRLGVDMVSADYLTNPAVAPVPGAGCLPRRPLAVRHQRPGRLPGRPRLAGRPPRHVRRGPQPRPVAATGSPRRRSQPSGGRPPELVYQRHPGSLTHCPGPAALGYCGSWHVPGMSRGWHENCESREYSLGGISVKING